MRDIDPEKIGNVLDFFLLPVDADDADDLPVLKNRHIVAFFGPLIFGQVRLGNTDGPACFDRLFGPLVEVADPTVFRRGNDHPVGIHKINGASPYQRGGCLNKILGQIREHRHRYIFHSSP